jgi:hypothetical protein
MLLLLSLGCPKSPELPEVDPVMVLEKGAEPRVPLRFSLKVGQKEQGAMTMKMSMGMEIDGNKLPMPAIPVMVMGMEMQVDRVRRETIDYSFWIASVDVQSEPGTPEEMGIIMRSSLAPMLGLSGEGWMTTRGQGGDFRIQLPPAASAQLQSMAAQMEQTINQVSAPFPEEPVGPGARWQTQTTVNQNGLSLVQTATYTLLEQHGNKIRLHSDVSSMVAPGEQSMTGLPPGTSLTALEVSMKGQGDSTFFLDRMFPEAASMHVGGTVSSRIESGGAENQFVVRLEMDMGMAGQKQ